MASPAAAASFPAIILFGDSLIEQAYSPGRDGSGATLADAYVRRADVLNRGLSGYNSDWLLPWLERVLAAQISEVLLWVVWVGTNDACLPEFVHHARFVPLERYKENICKMIKMIRENERSQHSRILFITPPPIDREMLGKYHRRKGADRSFDVTAEYAAAVKDLILDLGTDDSHLGVLDFYTVFMKKVANAPLNDEGSPSLREYLTDGLHLGPKGYQLLYGAFMVHVENHWPEILPKNIPLMVKLPLHIRPAWPDTDVMA
ncbi:SGNH hydrolase-type esterase domain-containing protein [Tricharina praecox]|uniref:SGNH hydrolase-type esterase domain-containing protein n=1 Tax=Tricharina praecox TaxID=43433 RepID=UPI00221E8B5E|nr:SGNH hydrolase-type esterase domain-containing protein [Tricharina praecox]KAI5848259.1 SGNH hydrolase-type esterase domain-containing protein [Tricharina praecox]